MLRLCVLGFICAILFAGGVHSDQNIRATRPINEGDSFVISMMTAPHNVKKCHLKPPQNDIITFIPGDNSESNDKYIIEEGNVWMKCMVNVLNADKSDEGDWVMTYDHDSDEAVTEETVHITVVTTEPEEEEETEEEADNVTRLSKIRHFTREGMIIDVSLDYALFEEECYIQPPNGDLMRSDEFKMDNVTVQSKSNYVSCRISIGPMSESLLGDWKLCGKSIEKDEIRCQPAHIAWNNNNPTALWEQVIQPRFNHPVHFGGSVNPGVAGRWEVITCHVITPDGEDLVITSDVKYPHIERIAFSSPGLCSINFTNIDRSSLGDWTIYGKFNAWLGGMNEVRLPLTFFLYNNENPYAQAYNVTVLPEERHLVILGTSLNVDVTGSGNVDNCLYRAPSGQTYDLQDNLAPKELTLKSLDSTTGCRASFDPVTEDIEGEWQIIGKFSNGNQFSERKLTFHVIKEDPANPIIDEFREVEYLSEVILDTDFGATNRITIPSVSFVENESCHLLTPSGLQYAFIPGYDIPNVEFIEGNGIACGVFINVHSLDMLGEWTLISRAARLSTPIERRLPFSVRIEETLSLGNAINITEGNDLYLSLPNATSLYETCKLYGPKDEEITKFEIDTFNRNSCGYIVRNVNRTHDGTWAIVYGNQITYRATVEVNILDSVNITLDDLVWNMGSTVNVTIGPEDAIYCSVKDNKFQSVSEGFGPCRIVVDRVTRDHSGPWRVSVGIAGTVVLHDASFNVAVKKGVVRPPVTTNVAKNGQSVILTCSVPIEYQVSACKFRDPYFNTMIASHGVGQDGFTGGMASYESAADSHDCTLRILNFADWQEGTWRCAVNTSQGVSHGFLRVTGFSVADHSDSYYNSQPVLRGAPDVYASEGDAVTMSCSIDASIRYCYFRASNGTVFNVGPSTSSHNYEYVGSGFDAGDCGIKFHNMWKSDAGGWTCHVGLEDDIAAEEQRSHFSVHVDEFIWMSQEWFERSIIVQFSMAGGHMLDYCRFVRIDGLGFTSDNTPSGYWVERYPILSGSCILHIEQPTMLDMHPWTVAAKVYGLDGEVFRTTNSSLLTLPMVGMRTTTAILLWLFFAILCLLLILAAVSLIPKNNRKWTYDRAAHIRNSFRRRPQPAQTTIVQTNHIDVVTELPPKF